MKANAAAVGLGIVLSAAAAAYCRTTTCDVPNAPDDCTYDVNGCSTNGKPLYWPDGCGWFGVQKDASPRSHISYETFHSTVSNAFGKWSKANCAGGAVPSFAMEDTDALYGPVECPDHEFNKHAPNASAWMFRDDSWPYMDPGNTIALTSVSVDLTTGRILDADVEINSFGNRITTSDTNVGADLDSIVTHEAGHFLGLAHSSVATATMAPRYPGISIRSLAPDDEEGICTVYPPGKAPACGPPEPLYGFSKYCGGVNPSTGPQSGGDDGCTCSVGVTPPRRNFGALLGAMLGGVAALRRRRWRPRTRQTRSKMLRTL
jgi:MYXO-CTERM domain-containing protein